MRAAVSGGASLYKGAFLFTVLKHLAAGAWDCGHVNRPGEPTIPSWHVQVGSPTRQEPAIPCWRAPFWNPGRSPEPGGTGRAEDLPRQGIPGFPLRAFLG